MLAHGDDDDVYECARVLYIQTSLGEMSTNFGGLQISVVVASATHF